MTLASWLGMSSEGARPDVLWEDGERLFCRAWRQGGDGHRQELVAVLPAAELPTPGLVNRLIHEYGLREHLERKWAARPLELLHEHGHTGLLLESSARLPLEKRLGPPMELGQFLRLAVALSATLGRMHRSGLVHKDIKPSNILVDLETEQVWLTGFGIASRRLRERQSPEPPELIAGTLAYMAPEQTGRMNRSIDSRSDLYSFGVVLYQMLVGPLPFTASDPMEWVHCHIARKPVAPLDRLKGSSAQVSALIMKLLAKTPEDRYQTAAGVEHDLRKCLADWEGGGSIAEFALGEHDRHDRLVVPEKLYGRAAEIETLVSAFDEVVATGTPTLVLVAGYSGIGKSSVVNELHKVLVPTRGLFASGKFDQHKAEIPYATFAQVFRTLIRSLLGKPEVELKKWRQSLAEALSSNGSLMLDLVPELSLLLGELPPVVDLPAQDAQRRLQLVARRFLGVFAQPEHPLALFLDDLQWLDVATLDLFESLLTEGDVRHLLLIGAYRDNEVADSHPLAKKLEAIRKTGSRVRSVTLSSLAQHDLEELIVDALHAVPERIRPLAELAQSKTGGNPFFAIQFLNSLAEEGLLAFDHGPGEWSWDHEQTLLKGYTDNVVDLILRKLTRLPAAVQQVLQELACLGDGAERTVLCVARQRSAAEVDADLSEAMQDELVVGTETAYRFAHDRIREAAYALFPDERRQQTHLRIGHRLLAHTPAALQKEAIFEVVNQLNRAASLIVDVDERQQLAELNLLAGKRSIASGAYAAALEYVKAAVATLPDASWQLRRDLAFSLDQARAECEFLTGDLRGAEQRLTALWARASNAVERAAVTCLRIDVNVNMGRADEAIAAGLDYLTQLDVHWSAHPPVEDARREYDLVWATLGDRTIEQLIDLPLMSDSTHRGMVDVLITLTTPAWLTDPNLLSLVTSRAVNLSLAHGNCDGSSVAYVMLGVVAGPQFGDYPAGYRLSALAYQLVEQRELTRFQARTYLFFGQLVLPWTKHVRVGRELVQRAYENAHKVGNLVFAAISAQHVTSNLLAAGDSLADTLQHIESSLAFSERRGFVLVVFTIIPQLGLVRSLCGLTPKFGTFDDAQINEHQFEGMVASNPIFAVAECFHWIRKLQARFFAGDHAAALEAASRAKPLLWAATAELETAEYHFFAALSHVAACDAAGRHQHTSHQQALTAHHRQLEVWAEACRENFESRVALVSAEIARLEGRDLEAMRLYDRAVHSAQTHSFVQHEALANELAGRFYAQREFEEIARLYLRAARHAYVRWGALGKVRQLDEKYPHLREVHPESPGSTIAASIDHLDLAAVIRVSQAVSSETALEKVIDILMRTALELAGAERGLLMLAHGDEYRIEAEAKTTRDGIRVTLRQAMVDASTLPESILQYVIRTREIVLLHDASAGNQFISDAYVREHGSRSMLCLPLLKQARLLGVLYLENSLTAGVFTPGRISILKVLASEAAISLENSRLYRDLRERESRLRRLVDSNIIGIFIARQDGQITDANDEFLRIVGHDRRDLVAGLVRWDTLTPDDWREADDQRVAEIEATGAHEPYEKEYLRKDGARAPVLVGSAMSDDRSEGVAFVLDLSERKRVEAAARQSDQRYHEIQLELSHANRVATLGQLSASIAHELNQPLTGILTNTGTLLRMLEGVPSNLDGAREIARRAVRDTHRAADVIQRLRALFSRADTTIALLDLNEAIREIISLSMQELRSRGVLLRLELADDLGDVSGDRIQLQQVMLNLIKNALDSMAVLVNEPRRLLIRTAATESGLLVTVEDSGPGLAKASLDRVFDAFYSTKPDGLGVGLSISRAIIQAHGGELWGTPAVPQGATFQFTLPASKYDARAQLPPVSTQTDTKV